MTTSWSRPPRRAETTAESTTETPPTTSKQDNSQPRRGKIVFVVLAFILLAGIVAVVPFSPVMPIKGIVVEGVTHLSAGDVEEAAGIAEGTPIGRANIREAAAGVARMPWVKTATVSRDWPSTVKVTVVENVAVAFTEEADGNHLIDQEGNVFARGEPPTGAVALRGGALEGEGVKADAVAIAASLSDLGREAVIALDARGPHDFALTLNDDRVVVWGANEDNANKALALEAALQLEGREFNISNPELLTVR